MKTAFRVLLVTVLFAMLGFAIGGFIGLLSILLMSAAHIRTNLQDALWFGALPGCALGSLAGLVIIAVSEKRATETKT
jgi:hypothetical protein